MPEPEYPFSTHTFMCPLRWDYLPDGYLSVKGKQSIHFDTRTDLCKIVPLLKGTPWQRSFYRINKDPLQYNEFTYFHAYATRTLFDLQRPDEKDEWMVNPNKTMVYLEIECGQDDYFLIETTSNNTYHLRLAGLGLHVYNTGIAILSIGVDNFRYEKPDAVLCINEFGRRIYPQFLGSEPPYTSATRHGTLPLMVELKCSKVNNGLPVREDFKQYDWLDGKETHKVDLVTGNYEFNTIIDFPAHIKQLFNDSFVFTSQNENGGDKIRFTIMSDDRMFFQSWYGNDGLSRLLRRRTELYGSEDGYCFAQSPFWYAYQFGDRSPGNLGIANKLMMEKDLLANTYSRWAEYGTLYAFTRGSFVSLSSNLASMINYAKIDIRQHNKTIYYQMAIICLAQRAGILRFSAEVAALTRLGRTHETEALDKIQHLYLNYIEFTNTICFREVTPQIQGIDIYTQFRKAMDIPQNVKSLDEEIKELHEFAMLIEQKRAADKAEKLSNIAAWFIPAGVIIGLMGINVLQNGMKFFGKPDPNAWKWIGFIVVLSITFSVFILHAKWPFRKKINSST